MSRGTFATGVAVRAALARQLGEPTPAVLKTAGRTSALVHPDTPSFGSHPAIPVGIRQQVLLSVNLAVTLAVRGGTSSRSSSAVPTIRTPGRAGTRLLHRPDRLRHRLR